MQTGDLIKSTASRNPLLFHRGIVVVEENGRVCIAHNTPMYRNCYGGNVIVETLESFLSDGRKILLVENSPLQYEDVYCWNDKVKAQKFDTMIFNCEHYVFGCLGDQRSPQLQSALIVTGFTALMVLV